MARTEYKKVKAAVEEERENLLKRMRDRQPMETIKANFKMACRETVNRRKEGEEEREKLVDRSMRKYWQRQRLKNNRQQSLRTRKQLRTPT